MFTVIDGKLMIDGKWAFNFYQKFGVPPEILEEWINHIRQQYINAK